LTSLRFQEIAQPPRRGDQDLRAAANRAQLIAFAQTADHHRGANAGARGEPRQRLVDLDRQLTGRVKITA